MQADMDPYQPGNGQPCMPPWSAADGKLFDTWPAREGEQKFARNGRPTVYGGKPLRTGHAAERASFANESPTLTQQRAASGRNCDRNGPDWIEAVMNLCYRNAVRGDHVFQRKKRTCESPKATYVMNHGTDDGRRRSATFGPGASTCRWHVPALTWRYVARRPILLKTPYENDLRHATRCHCMSADAQARMFDDGLCCDPATIETRDV